MDFDSNVGIRMSSIFFFVKFSYSPFFADSDLFSQMFDRYVFTDYENT